MPDRWLLKTEPGEYSFDDLLREKRTCWEGVTNNQALQFIRRIAARDQCLIYHTGKERAIVGIAEAVKGPYPDPSANDPKIVVFDIKPVRKLAAPVPLTAIKADPRFRDFELVRISRLSVMPVGAELWKALLEMGRS